MKCTCCPHCNGEAMTGVCNHGPDQGACDKCVEEGGLTDLLNRIRTYKHRHAVNGPAYANYTELQTSIRNRVATLNK